MPRRRSKAGTLRAELARRVPDEAACAHYLSQTLCPAGGGVKGWALSELTVRGGFDP
jgi:hypothetical protein